MSRNKILPVERHIQDIYGISVSDSTVSRITDKILPIAKEWQQRPLEAIYAVVFLDAIHYHVRSEGQIVKKAVYKGRRGLERHSNHTRRGQSRGAPHCYHTTSRNYAILNS